MTHTLENIAALVIVAAAAVGLALRAWAKRSRPGCGGECGCSQAIRVKTDRAA